MNQITKETRKLSYDDIMLKVKGKYYQVLETLANKEMSAKEVAIEMFDKGFSKTSERNVSAPRLNELVKLDIVEIIGKKKCQHTNKVVAVYKIK